MREHFESAASSLIKVDPYRRSYQKNGTSNITASVFSIDFAAGRCTSGVDLRWHPRKDFIKLSQNQRSELVEWMKTYGGKDHMSRRSQGKEREHHPAQRKRRKFDSKAGGDRKRKFKKAVKTENGLCTIMSVLTNEELTNAPLISALQAQVGAPLPPPSINMTSSFYSKPNQMAIDSLLASVLPATSTKLQSILKRSPG